MFSKTWGFILKVLSFIGLPGAAFFAAYHVTDHFFQTRRIPYPFQLFGLAYGLAAASWALAIAFFITALSAKIKHKKTSAYLVKEKKKLTESEILK